MKITVIHGTEHKGSTYHIAQAFLKEFETESTSVTEFFLPKDMPAFCCGCFSCILKGAEYCPHRQNTSPIADAIQSADLLIFTSPVYAYHVTGQMKVLLDHYCYQWMVHRPDPCMFSKVALIISTAAGAGIKSTHKDIKDSLIFWGVGNIFTYGKAVAAASWQGVNAKKKEQIAKETKTLSVRILHRLKNTKPSLKVKMLFFAMRFMHKTSNISAIDKDYWQRMGWLNEKRPWGKKT